MTPLASRSHALRGRVRPALCAEGRRSVQLHSNAERWNETVGAVFNRTTPMIMNGGWTLCG